jgi:hypothetical protein
MTRVTFVLALLLLAIAGCASSSRNSSEAAWQRGQCEQIVDEDLRKKCLERVERELGSTSRAPQPEPARKR